MHVCLCVWVHMDVHACGGPGLKLGIFLSNLYISISRQNLSTVSASLASQFAPGVPCLQKAGIACGPRHPQAYVGPGGGNSSLQDGKCFTH